MKISEAIQTMKNYCKGIGFDGNPINEEKTRDKILYGNPDQEITGIVTTCYASVDVVKRAQTLSLSMKLYSGIMEITLTGWLTTKLSKLKNSCWMKETSVSGETMTTFILEFQWKALTLMVSFMA